MYRITKLGLQNLRVYSYKTIEVNDIELRKPRYQKKFICVSLESVKDIKQFEDFKYRVPFIALVKHFVFRKDIIIIQKISSDRFIANIEDNFVFWTDLLELKTDKEIKERLNEILSLQNNKTFWLLNFRDKKVIPAISLFRKLRYVKNLRPEDYHLRKIKLEKTMFIHSWVDEQMKKNDLELPETNLIDYKIIIQWNEDKKVITDIFKQLKAIYNKEGEPVVGNSIPEIASFLKVNVSCFENTKLSTIETMLKGTDNPPKTSRRIIIEREKPQ